MMVDSDVRLAEEERLISPKKVVAAAR